MYKRTLKLLGVLLATLIVGGSCTKQNLDSCEGFTLRLRYALNSDNNDLFHGAVGDLRIYAFDPQGILVYSTRINAAQYPDGLVRIPIPDGKYDVLVLAVDGSDAQKDYLFCDLLDANTLHYEQARIGTTRTVDFRTILAFDHVEAELEGEITPRKSDFNHLFYGSARNFQVEWTKNQIVDVDLMRNTHLLDVNITGVSHLFNAIRDLQGANLDRPVQAFLVGPNGWYDHDNLIDDSPQVRYEPYQDVRNGDNQHLTLKTQRLMMKYHTAHPLMLYIRETATGNDLVPPIDLLKAIKSIPNGSGQSLFQTQESLDRQEVFPIDISVSSSLNITVSILEWVIVDVEGGLVRP